MVTPRPKRLTDVLLEVGLVDQAGLQRAIGLVQQTGRRLLAVLVESGLVDEVRLVRSLSQTLGVETVELNSIQINERVIARLPAMIAQTFGVLPLAAKRANGLEYLYVAMADPLDSRAAEEIRKSTGCRLSVLVASPTQLETMLNRHYGPSKTSSSPPPPPRANPVAKPVPSPPDIIGQPVIPLGIENFRSDIIQTQLDPEISDIIITPALDDVLSSPQAADELQPITDHGHEVSPVPAANGIPNKLLESMNQAWDDGKTLDFDVDDFQGRQAEQKSNTPTIKPVPNPESPSDLSASFASALAMEVPLAAQETSSPFDGVAEVNLPPGLERTGIIPVNEFNQSEFEPPPVEDEASQGHSDFVGLGDIPKSDEEVRLRASEGNGSNAARTAQESSTGHGDLSQIIPAPADTQDEPAPSEPPKLPPKAEESPKTQPSNPCLVSEITDNEAHALKSSPAAEEKTNTEMLTTDNGEAHDMVRALRKGRSLNSAERAQLLLALGRVMLDKGLITEEELVMTLASESSSK